MVGTPAEPALMNAPTPEQTLVLAAIERFMDDPDLAVADGDGQEGDVLEAILQALVLVLPLEEIEAAMGGLLSDHGERLDDDTQLVLEALLMALDSDEEETALEQLLAQQATRVEANAQVPHRLLVWDPGQDPGLLELELPELLEIYPCEGEQARWRPDDVVALLEAKARQWRRTMVALEVLRERPTAHPSAGTMLLVVPHPPQAPLEQAALAISLSRPSPGPPTS